MKTARGIVGKWAMAFGTSLLLTVGWWLLFAPASQPEARALPLYSFMSYYPVLSDGDKGLSPDSVLRAEWSPMLFSLPSKFGFSGQVDDRRSSLVPRVEIPPLQPMYSPRTQQAAEEETAYVDGWWIEQKHGPFPDLPLYRAAQVQRHKVADPVRVSAPQLLLVEGVLDHLEYRPLPDLNVFTNAGIFRVQISFASNGMVRHAWVDPQPSDLAVPGKLLLALHTWRAVPGEQPRSLIFDLHLPDPEGVPSP